MRTLLTLLLMLLCAPAQAAIFQNSFTTNSPARTPNLLATSTNVLYPLLVLNPDGTGTDRQILYSPSLSLRGTNVFINEADAISINATNIYVSNLFATNLFVTYITNIFTQDTFTTNLYVSNVFATNIYVTNLYATNIFTTNLYATNIYTSNFFATNVFTTNLYATNVFTTNLYTSNFYSTNIFTTNLYATNIYTSNFFATNVITTNIYVSNLYATNIFATNLIVLETFEPTQFRTNGGVISIKNGPILTNVIDTGTSALDTLQVTNGISALGVGVGVMTLKSSGDSLQYSLTRAASPTTNAFITTPTTIQSGFLYTAFTGTNGTESYIAIPTNATGGSGTTGTIPFWADSTTLADSVITTNASGITIAGTLHVNDGSVVNPGIAIGIQNSGFFRGSDSSINIGINGTTQVGLFGDGEFGSYNGLSIVHLRATNSIDLITGGGTGKLLTSDSTGVGNWVAPAGAPTTGTNIVTLTQTGTNAAQMDFSLVQNDGVFKLVATNNVYFGTPANVANTVFRKAWLMVQQPSTGTCLITFTNGQFAFPSGAAPVNDTNNGSVTLYEFVSDVFTNGILHGRMTSVSKLIP